MIDWKAIRKMDAHIHILPDEVHDANPDSMGEFAYGKLDRYVRLMDSYNIQKSVIMPFNDPYLMSMGFTVQDVHRNLYDMKKRFPGRLFAFADIDVRNTVGESIDALVQAVEQYQLDGLKIHPTNTDMSADSTYNKALVAKAQELHIPVAVHCYPNSEEDPCAAARVADLIGEYPDIPVIVAHMGAFQWQEILKTDACVDISAILPDYVRTYGIAGTNEILRAFGAERVIFGTDYPTSRLLPPESIYMTYFDILAQMDFTQEEVEKMAYGNVASMLETGC